MNLKQIGCFLKGGHIVPSPPKSIATFNDGRGIGWVSRCTRCRKLVTTYVPIADVVNRVNQRLACGFSWGLAEYGLAQLFQAQKKAAEEMEAALEKAQQGKAEAVPKTEAEPKEPEYKPKHGKKTEEE